MVSNMTKEAPKGWGQTVIQRTHRYVLCNACLSAKDNGYQDRRSTAWAVNTKNGYTIDSAGATQGVCLNGITEVATSSRAWGLPGRSQWKTEIVAHWPSKIEALFLGQFAIWTPLKVSKTRALEILWKEGGVETYNDTLVIRAIDSGSSVNVLFIGDMDQTELGEHRVDPVKTPIFEFTMVDVPSSYYVILGRPAMATFMDVEVRVKQKATKAQCSSHLNARGSEHVRLVEEDFQMTMEKEGEEVVLVPPPPTTHSIVKVS
ncbi:hypothetical protein F511_36500 [Dorcoceras hygrometricum]|uniref:Uncharacterized protein n=1 Tax=Dorcoceras hygrometricum TaxID=472368 RepID=A0A2Z7D5A8_9LAMI|nr:hypothetical protein F511_36500 [Dorcoceras hygrometricum]